MHTSEPVPPSSQITPRAGCAPQPSGFGHASVLGGGVQWVVHAQAASFSLPQVLPWKTVPLGHTLASGSVPQALASQGRYDTDVLGAPLQVRLHAQTFDAFGAQVRCSTVPEAQPRMSIAPQLSAAHGLVNARGESSVDEGGSTTVPEPDDVEAPQASARVAASATSDAATMRFEDDEDDD